MEHKNVSDMVFDKLSEELDSNNLFCAIKEELITQIRSKRPSKKEIENILQRVENADS